MNEDLAGILEKWIDCPVERLSTYYLRDDLVEPVYILGDKVFVLNHSEPENNYYSWDVKEKTPLLEKLALNYKERINLGNYAGIVGYSVEGPIEISYEFSRGIFTVRTRHLIINPGDEAYPDFAHFNYDPKD